MFLKSGRYDSYYYRKYGVACGGGLCFSEVIGAGGITVRRLDVGLGDGLLQYFGSLISNTSIIHLNRA